MLQSKSGEMRMLIKKIAEPFSSHSIQKNKYMKNRFSTERKILIYEYVHEDDCFLSKKSNSIKSIMNYNYVNKKINEINYIIKNYNKINTLNKDKIIDNLYILCVKGNIGLSDERIIYYVNNVLEYINKYINHNDDIIVSTQSDISEKNAPQNYLTDENKNGCDQKNILDIERYIKFLKVLRVLNIENSFNNLLKYVSKNIHFFHIDIVRKISVNHKFNDDQNFFFKDVLNYIHTIIQCNNSIYYKEIKNINICLNVCTNFFFAKKLSKKKATYHFVENYDIVYMYNLNYIYMNHIIVIGTILDGNKINNEEETVANINLHIHNGRGEKNTHTQTPDINNITFPTSTSNGPATYMNDKLCKDSHKNDEHFSTEMKMQNNMEKIEIDTKYIDDFDFNYNLVDTIYVAYKYYTYLGMKKKKKKEASYSDNNEHGHNFFFCLPDIKKYITNIVCNFINIINRDITGGKLKNIKKIILSLERINELVTSFDVPFKLDPFLVYHCNILLASKIDLTVLDNIKILGLLRNVIKRETKNLEKKKNSNTVCNDYITDLSTSLENKNKNDENNGSSKNADSNHIIKTSSLLSYENEVNKRIDNSLFDNMIKLIFDNLKNCLHNCQSNDLCLLIPMVYEFHKYMDEEIKNILTVQVIFNKDNINQDNIINILRVFSKIKYKNEAIDKFLYNRMKIFNTGCSDSNNSFSHDMPEEYMRNGGFSYPKNFYLFFYYKSKNKLFSYKDIYYIENYIQKNFFEMNIKDFLYVLLIYYKNCIFLLPQLLLKIAVIFNNAKKNISHNDLLFCLFLLSKNYYLLSMDSNNSSIFAHMDEEENNIYLNKMNMFRKNKYNQHHIDNFINIINDILSYLYDDKMINYKPYQLEYNNNVEDKTVSDLYEIKENQKVDDMRSKEINQGEINKGDILLTPNDMLNGNEQINEFKWVFQKLKYNFIMMKIFYNFYYSIFKNNKKNEKKILNSQHEKFILYLFTCFNQNFSKDIKEIKYVSSLLYYFSYFNIYSSSYFDKQMLYILQNCEFDDHKIVANMLLSYVFINKEIQSDIKKHIKEYIIKNFEHFNKNDAILCFKHSNYFLNLQKTENVDKSNDHILFIKLLNFLVSNLEKYKPQHYLYIYTTICNNFVKEKKIYIKLFYYMNKFATHYNSDQLFLILFYMYKTGYSKPKIRKKIRNLILYYHKKRMINISTYVKYILPLDEFGIYHLFPIKFQNTLYNQLGEDIKTYVRKPLMDNENNSETKLKNITQKEQENNVQDYKKEDSGDAPIYVFEQMVKNY
ncbi:conserved Plasmodium protein, unknown function [Plasmodium chabaudi chabaudi]|uniref:Uncharacterized protein n=1 Tax=Plasmodium chabaudi chabaudi TaxID=31271 RepID=A0A1C6X8A7_PLACU|nr:conserved Plasmodium protein, unknown function [Plasmodium chabaudi chabaudi]